MLEIMLTDTDFAGGADGAKLEIGGTTQGTVDAAGFADDANAEFGGAAFASVTGLGPGSFSFTGSGPVSLTDPFSLSISTKITHTAAGQITSFDALVSTVPEPGNIALALTSLPLLGGLYFRQRRMKKSA